MDMKLLVILLSFVFVVQVCGQSSYGSYGRRRRVRKPILPKPFKPDPVKAGPVLRNGIMPPQTVGFSGNLMELQGGNVQLPPFIRALIGSTLNSRTLIGGQGGLPRHGGAGPHRKHSNGLRNGWGANPNAPFPNSVNEWQDPLGGLSFPSTFAGEDLVRDPTGRHYIFKKAKTSGTGAGSHISHQIAKESHSRAKSSGEHQVMKQADHIGRKTISGGENIGFGGAGIIGVDSISHNIHSLGGMEGGYTRRGPKNGQHHLNKKEHISRKNMGMSADAGFHNVLKSGGSVHSGIGHHTAPRPMIINSGVHIGRRHGAIPMTGHNIPPIGHNIAKSSSTVDVIGHNIAKSTGTIGGPIEHTMNKAHHIGRKTSGGENIGFGGAGIIGVDSISHNIHSLGGMEGGYTRRGPKNGQHHLNKKEHISRKNMGMSADAGFHNVLKSGGSVHSGIGHHTAPRPMIINSGVHIGRRHGAIPMTGHNIPPIGHNIAKSSSTVDVIGHNIAKSTGTIGGPIEHTMNKAHHIGRKTSGGENIGFGGAGIIGVDSISHNIPTLGGMEGGYTGRGPKNGQHHLNKKQHISRKNMGMSADAGFHNVLKSGGRVHSGIGHHDSIKNIVDVNTALRPMLIDSGVHIGRRHGAIPMTGHNIPPIGHNIAGIIDGPIEQVGHSIIKSVHGGGHNMVKGTHGTGIAGHMSHNIAKATHGVSQSIIEGGAHARHNIRALPPMGIRRHVRQNINNPVHNVNKVIHSGMASINHDPLASDIGNSIARQVAHQSSKFIDMGSNGGVSSGDTFASAAAHGLSKESMTVAKTILNMAKTGEAGIQPIVPIPPVMPKVSPGGYGRRRG